MLAPLTLLVGENSTGKTSFLAMIRALWDVAFVERVPDFREQPYDLGTFSEIIHSFDDGHIDSDLFDASFEILEPESDDPPFSFSVQFSDWEGFPFPTVRRAAQGDTWFQVDSQTDRDIVRLGAGQHTWTPQDPIETLHFDGERLIPMGMLNSIVGGQLRRHDHRPPKSGALNDGLIGTPSEDVLTEVVQRVDELLSFQSSGWRGNLRGNIASAPFAGAPIRSQPKRTYDPTRPIRDPEGEYIPHYLAGLSRREPAHWIELKKNLEDFGQQSGLFDEVSIESLGNTAAGPFQLKIGKTKKQFNRRHRNIIDMGYGVSQALPIITELLRPDTPAMFLLQQPEVHLHPSAQAALGTLFCSVARPSQTGRWLARPDGRRVKIGGPSGRQLIVETHSDYILDRVRMDIRDKKTALTPREVSILYFEAGESGVKIHSLSLDQDGNVQDAPAGYGRFFLEETRRSIGL